MAIQVLLENFSGPLDLLLHLIKSNEMEVCDIRIVEITEQYLDVINQMQYLDLDIAGEFLLMASTLTHIKSKMLLPVSDDIEDEEGEDPRAELVRRLLEYQRYKDAAGSFDSLPQLNRDFFLGEGTLSEVLQVEAGDGDDVAVGIFHLAEAFQRVLRNRPREVFHEVVREPLSVAQYIRRLAQELSEKKRIAFHDFFTSDSGRNEVIVTFLAMLELVKMRYVVLDQAAEFSSIWLVLKADAEQLRQLTADEEDFGYG